MSAAQRPVSVLTGLFYRASFNREAPSSPPPPPPHHTDQPLSAHHVLVLPQHDPVFSPFAFFFFFFVGGGNKQANAWREKLTVPSASTAVALMSPHSSVFRSFFGE